jgi:hypothetical protein
MGAGDGGVFGVDASLRALTAHPSHFQVVCAADSMRN